MTILQYMLIKNKNYNIKLMFYPVYKIIKNFGGKLEVVAILIFTKKNSYIH